MPLRTRLRRVFGRSSQDSTLTIKSKTKSSSSKDDSIYQPGEKMPPPKYRRPVDPEHKANLEAFNWAKAWRRKSDQSAYSPMGSRLPSRKNSFTTVGRRSFGGRPSTGRKKSSDGEGSAVDSGVGVAVGEPFREGSDEEHDVTNVGLSRQHTHDSTSRSKRPSGPYRSHSVKSASSRHRSSSTKDKPFDVDELDLALKRSHLEAPKEERESDGSGGQSPGTDAAKA